MIQINYTSKFKKSLQKITPPTIKVLEAKLKLFRQDPYAAPLKTHKLKGKLAHYWAFSVTRSMRILFVFENKEEITFINIGSHEIYR
ncbi:type II toxin-antitoxin system mRNA interferase toxin, RelE/StbE family [Candidatus Microgenomates bacterium]|nr:type II toxin-antitoxin system mRNA interferase toxin, RelE/StbE family [Candidatus Microgenomates bacterium]